MSDIYTFVLDVDGGTYMSQKDGDSVRDALKVWASSPDADVLKAFGTDDNVAIGQAVESIAASPEGVIPISGLKSVWFVNLQINNADGFLNIIRTL